MHRDVKPANVLVEERDGHEHAYLSDFGLAKSADASRAGPTRTGTFVGTINYVAPEQITHGRADARSDVYSLGCLLYEALTGEPPFRRDSDVATLWAHVHDETPSVTAGRANLPPAFDEVLAKALAKDPDERYLSAGDLGRAALAAAHGEAVPGRGRSVARGAALHGVLAGRRRLHWSRRRLALVAVPILVGAGIAVGVLAAAGAFWGKRYLPEQRRPPRRPLPRPRQPSSWRLTGWPSSTRRPARSRVSCRPTRTPRSWPRARAASGRPTRTRARSPSSTSRAARRGRSPRGESRPDSRWASTRFGLLPASPTPSRASTRARAP